MKRFRLLGLAFLVLLALGSIVSATAFAEELDMLPEGTTTSPLKFKVKSGPGKLEIEKGLGSAVKCAKDTGTGEFTSKRLGKFDVLFEGCLAESIAGLFLCTGLGDKEKSSSILVLGEFHLRRLLNNEPKHIVVFFLINEVHFSCEGAINVLIRVKGCVVGLLLPEPNKLTKTGKVTLTQKGGLQAITEADTDNELGMETCILLASEGSGEFKDAGEETTEELEGFEQNKVSVEVLLMA